MGKVDPPRIGTKEVDLGIDDCHYSPSFNKFVADRISRHIALQKLGFPMFWLIAVQHQVSADIGAYVLARRAKLIQLGFARRQG